MAALQSSNSTSVWNRSSVELNRFRSLSEMDVPAESSPALRIIISIVYLLVCAAGLLGNLLVFFLMKAGSGRRKNSAINMFILHLAVTDFQFVLTLPFWAVDIALDFSWPFGNAMCKILLTVTVMNMYASVFFLTAMSVTRYWSVASAVKKRRLQPAWWLIPALWLCAMAASLPTAVFSTVRRVAGERLCLMGFPEGQPWFLFHYLQKLLVGFVFPMLIVTVCYLLLLRFVRLRCRNNHQVKRSSKVTRSVTIVVLSFFICWMPNQAITLWSLLVKLNLLHWDLAYYMVHTYLHPVTVCLAHTNSCLNPVLYCLMRREFRKRIKALFWRMSSPSGRNPCRLRPFSRAVREDTQTAVPLNILETVLTDQCDTDAEQQR
ncbi:relaxin-3 receptor 1-like [Cyprinodon tularosa]|uniref:relaxin-3 receptor 1-like n=1 Tax=Cyprinodon tularosa TaxID=77115 RepID=UPI0018E20EA8|nr:relaxin-3 receptor 1-like [Cyprinodon tularosa]